MQRRRRRRKREGICFCPNTDSSCLVLSPGLETKAGFSKRSPQIRRGVPGDVGAAQEEGEKEGAGGDEGGDEDEGRGG